MRVTYYSIMFLISYNIFQISYAQTIHDSITPEEIVIAKSLIQGAFDEIWSGLDSAKISTYHTDDFMILENGKVWSNDNIKEYIKKQLSREDAPERVNRMKYVSIQKYGNSMQIVYHNFADLKYDGITFNTNYWLESALAVKTKEGWRLRFMHSTYVKN